MASKSKWRRYVAKPATHRFVVLVASNGRRIDAERNLLCCFAARQPDGCEFHLLKRKPKL